MDSPKLDLFVELLRQQSSGDSTTIDRLRQLQPRLEDGYCLFNLYEQWSQAFAYNPGRLGALPSILRLAEHIKRQKDDNTLSLYRTLEWSALVALRGPVETVLLYSCSDCGREYPKMGTSGFLDEIDWLCPKCGAVYFRSVYDKSAPPLCQCGGSFRAPSSSCPYCGSSRSQSSWNISPYEYFEHHRFYRDA